MWRNQALCEPRTIYSLTELSPTFNLGVNNADVMTLATALLERMYYCKVGDEFVPPPTVDPALFSSRLRTYHQQVCTMVGKAAPISLPQVVEMYSGRKKTIYANALVRHQQSGWKDKYAWLKAFVKMEKVNPNKAPRCIQPRDPVYNLVLGSYIKPLEHRVYKAIDRVFGDGPTVMKGYDVERIARIARGKWNTFTDPAALDLDAVKFDMHVSATALRWEHTVYNAAYRSKELHELLRRQVVQRGVARCKDGHLTYKVEGRRASGDMNTALGNCLIMCGLIYAYAKERQVNIKLMNNGDDCVVMMERPDVSRFLVGLDDWFLQMGFRMTCGKVVYSLAEIEFCQMHPIEYGNGKIIMVRNIPMALRKESLVTLDVRSNKALEGWLNAVGQGGLSMTGGIPILQNLYRRFIQLSNGRVTKVSTELRRHQGMWRLKGPERCFEEPTAEARLSVYKAWGITPDIQIGMEEYLDSYEYDRGVVVGIDSLINTNPILHALSR